MGHAVATGLAGLVVYVTGSFNLVMVMSVGFSTLGVVVISMLDDTSHVLIPNWEDDLPLEGRQITPSLGSATADN